MSILLKMLSGDDTVAPSAITNFNASDNQTGKVIVTFSPASGFPAPTYDLYENGSLVASDIASGYERVVSAGIRTYYVKAVNSAGAIPSNSNTGLSMSVPSYISNFNASDNLVGKVTVTWSNATAYPAPTYDLYENGVKVASNISSGYQRSVGAGIRSYYVKAVNSAGSTNSNSNNGTSKAPAGSQTFLAGGTFTVPVGYTTVHICMIGGGGGGASVRNYSGAWGTVSWQYAGGGKSGQIVNQNVSVSSGQQISVVIGAGGGSEWRCDSCGNRNGLSGGQSKFGGIIANGGAGGRADGSYHKGSGSYRAVCAGTFRDGTITENSSYGYRAYGGQAGFGNGGIGKFNVFRPYSPYNPNDSINGTKGSGGGGGISSTKDNGYGWGGWGGKGVCIVSWS